MCDSFCQGNFIYLYYDLAPKPAKNVPTLLKKDTALVVKSSYPYNNTVITDKRIHKYFFAYQ